RCAEPQLVDADAECLGEPLAVEGARDGVAGLPGLDRPQRRSHHLRQPGLRPIPWIGRLCLAPRAQLTHLASARVHPQLALLHHTAQYCPGTGGDPPGWRYPMQTCFCGATAVTRARWAG